MIISPQISITDQLPKVVCEDCAFKVDEIFNFREKVLQTENMFRQMLKTIAKKEVDALNNVNINVIRGNIERLSNGIDDKLIPVMDNVELNDREPVSTQEEMNREETDIEVAGFHIDGETVRMVNEQMREVKLITID